MSIIKHVILQKIVAHDFRYDLRMLMPEDGQNMVEKCSIYRVIHKSVKHFKNSQQIDYATDHGNSYANREGNSPSFF